MIRMPGDTFFQGVFRALLFVAVALSLAMAVMSTTAKQVHHDEYDHINAARFYATNWLPPAVGDPRTFDSYSLYGSSYLNEWDIVYALAGKFAALVDPLIGDFSLSLRLFNVTLLFILACVALASRNAILGYAILLTSPQIWYTFSYFNADVFPLFVCFLTVPIFATWDGAIPRAQRGTVRRYVLLGVCIGILVVSKKTFWAFGLFAVGLAAWLDLHRCLLDKDFAWLLRGMTLLVATVVLTAGPRVAYDYYTNGGPAQKLARMAEVADELAAPAFHRKAPTKKYMNLRKSGVSLLDTMRPPLSWARKSFFSMFGSYNYGRVYSWPSFYYLFVGIYALFLAYLTAVVAMRGDGRDRVALSGAIATAALAVGLSAHHSWTSDFQPQGRYLFAVFALVAVILVRNAGLLRPIIVNLFLFATFMLSVQSFVKDGLSSVPHFRDISEISAVFRRPD